MSWFSEPFFHLFKPNSVALTVLVIGAASALGLALGSLKFRGVSLGIGGVRFAGLLIGKLLGEHKLDHHVVDFAKEAGLILFVYTIGVTVGPGFFASLRRQGLGLNGLAALIIGLGVLTTIAVSKFAAVPMKDAVGLMSGATTNTPSLAAANQALADRGVPPDQLKTGAAYAIAYPFGILGIILAMIGVRAAFRVKLAAEAARLAAADPQHNGLVAMNLLVTNPNLDGRTIERIPSFDDGDVVVSRVMRAGPTADAATRAVEIASPQTVVRTGDVLLVVGPEPALEDLRVVVGERATVDCRRIAGSPITTRKLLVTHRAALGRTVDELHLPQRLGVTVTRVRRNEIDFPPGPRVRLQFGDTVIAVGPAAAIDQAAAELGNSVNRLNHPQLAAVCVAILAGVVLGSLPIALPGMPAPIKLGLAGGPLIAAIVLSRMGHFGPLVWHLPQSASFVMKEIGILLFLACVGVASGAKFFDALASGEGWRWMACGALITALPLATVALVARVWMKMNYFTLCGLLAGSMTDPPALAFAGQATQSDAPSIAYAAVYPLTMVLRVVVGQVLVLTMV
ncbi:MAG TPA: putative transporter [Tepidisphaeraceae bacterium]|nr:putative transporter [Tepidisphaeraceae bacterium]